MHKTVKTTRIRQTTACLSTSVQLKKKTFASKHWSKNPCVTNTGKQIHPAAPLTLPCKFGSIGVQQCQGKPCQSPQATKTTHVSLQTQIIRDVCDLLRVGLGTLDEVGLEGTAYGALQAGPPLPLPRVHEHTLNFVHLEGDAEDPAWLD